jgi:uncharacterized protein YprB with RNaseH-like and TPR domain
MKKLPDKILFVDIETAPNLGFTWAKYEQTVFQFLQEGYLLCFAWKWLGDKTIHARSLPDYDNYTENKSDDQFLAMELHKLFNEADIIVAHNGDGFDIKKSNTYFIESGLKPPSPYKTIDTLKIARRKFKFNSNKLDDLGEHLGLGRKEHTDKNLWFGCMNGDIKSWKKMVSYNKQDIVLLENVYNKFLPWIDMPKIHPENDNCRNCGGSNLTKQGTRMTVKGRVQNYQCVDCGHWSTSKVIVDL